MFGNTRYVNIYISSIANLKSTPTDRQMYHQGSMYPRLGTSILVEPRKTLYIAESTLLKLRFTVCNWIFLTETFDDIKSGLRIRGLGTEVSAGRSHLGYEVNS